MDILSHLLLGINITNFVNKPEEKIIILIASILPDIGEIFIQKELNKKYGAKLGVYDERTSDLSIASNVKVTWIYDLLHSPTFYGLLFILSQILKLDFVNAFAIGGLFHISLDFATHGKVWALKLFFPFSNKRFPIFEKQLGNWWEWNPKFTLPYFKLSLPLHCALVWFILSISILALNF